MPWTVVTHDAFDPEFDALDEAVQDELLAMMGVLEAHGPSLGRPHVDTLSGSRHANMKELRFSVDGGVWRFAFAFDPSRQAVVLVGGNKSGMTTQRFYKPLIRRADARFDQWLKSRKPPTS